MKSSNIKAQSSKIRHLDFGIWILMFIFTILAGCGWLPRIIILDDPLSAEEHLTLGISYEAKGMLDEAILEYKASLSKERSYSKALVNLGNVYYKKGDYEKAEGHYIDALNIDRNNPHANNNLAWIFVAKGIKLDEAERLAMRAVEKDPKNKAYYLETLALIYYKTGRFKDALQKLDEAESLNSSSDELLKKAVSEDREKVLKSMKPGDEGKTIIKDRDANAIEAGKE